ncbi:MAG: ABC transporter permease [Cyclobacteriaceae bacterium]
MNNIGLIIGREYMTRVKKKSFIIMTFLAPLLFVGIFGLIGYLSTRGGDTKEIEVLDESGLFAELFVSDDDEAFIYIDTPLDSAKKHVERGTVDGLIYIPEIADLDNPDGVSFYAPGNPSLNLVRSIERKIENEIESIKLLRSGLTQEILDGLESNVSIHSINLSSSGEEKDSSSGTATGVGYFAAFMIYMFIFIYGAQCMRGVIEEKTSRIVEVIISSVRPFHLMMGKVIGIAAVGFTQLAMWIVLTAVLGSVGLNIFSARMEASSQVTDAIEQTSEVQAEINNPVEDIMKSVNSINIPLTLGAFIFYFIGGYLLYSALFAAVGSAVDSDADAQQFMFPITIPLIAAIASLGAVLLEPHGTFAFWMSMIPFTSPVVMMMRVPFGVPLWELGLSMVLLIGGFIFTIWLASRIYRIGILMHGTKVNYKVLAKWFMMKN